MLHVNSMSLNLPFQFDIDNEGGITKCHDAFALPIE
jgi:hypothetical protein